MKRGSFSAIASVAYKEFLHIYRDRRVLILLLILPPVFTLVFGHAFEAGEMTNVPAMLDQSRRHSARGAFRRFDLEEQDLPLAH